MSRKVGLELNETKKVDIPVDDTPSEHLFSLVVDAVHGNVPEKLPMSFK